MSDPNKQFESQQVRELWQQFLLIVAKVIALSPEDRLEFHLALLEYGPPSQEEELRVQ